jgi:hypothetical protein
MLLKNKTAMFQIARKGEQKYVARPWRIIDVPDDAEYGKDVFEIFKERQPETKTEVVKKENKKGKGD